jgi:hypothetical protein
MIEQNLAFGRCETVISVSKHRRIAVAKGPKAKKPPDWRQAALDSGSWPE